MASTLTQGIPKTGFKVPVFEMPEKEKNKWPLSFLLAAGLHALVLLGAQYAFITPPEYGIEGTAASMHIYMVAALPSQSEKPIVTKLPPQKIESPEGVKSDMEIYQPKPEEEKKQQDDLAKKNAEEKNKIKGDGSSATPGQSVTTLFSRGSAETSGKDGKYQNPPPPYPSLAERKGWEGVVLLKVLVEKEGRPSQVVLEQSSGHNVLDEAAVKAVKKWQFTAGRIGNMEVSSWIKIPIRFALEKKH